MSDPLSSTLAARLREERRRRRLSLRRLAESSGLSTTTVHQIEAARGSPSLATLQALATALGVPLASMFESGPPPPDAAVFLRAGERPSVRTTGGVIERLASGLPGQRLRGLALTFEPGGDTGPDAMTHPGHELIVGLAGTVVYEVAGLEYRVASGDSLLVDSQKPHRARNEGSCDAQFLLVLYAPEEEPDWVERHARRDGRGRS